MQAVRGKLTYANVVATLALIVAVTGGTTAVAVKKAPKGATVKVTKKSDITKSGKIRPNRVTKEKIAAGAIGANQLGTILIRQAPGNPARAFCQAGERRIAGGASATVQIGASFPESALGLEGWTGGGDSNVTAYVLCLAP